MARKTVLKQEIIIINNRFFGVYNGGAWYYNEKEIFGKVTTLLIYFKDFDVTWYPMKLKNGRRILLPEINNKKLIWKSCGH